LSPFIMIYQRVTLASFALLAQSHLLKGVASSWSPGEEAVLLLPGKNINCEWEFDVNKENCIAAAESVGGKLRGGRFLVGSWPNSPANCFIEPTDNGIHYNTNMGGKNNGYFRSVCKAPEDKVIVKDAYKGSECSSGHSYAIGECADKAREQGGVLVNGAMKIGPWAHIPYGCSLQESDNVIHFGTNIYGINAGQFKPVCVAGTDKGIVMPAREKTTCEPGYDFPQTACIEVALSLGGKLRDDKIVVGNWPNAPNACFWEKADKAIHFNNNQLGVNDGQFNPICKVGIIKAALLPAYKGTKCDPADAIAVEDCVASAAAIGGTLRDGVFKIGEYANGPSGCFVEASDKAIHFGTGSTGVNDGAFHPVCVAGAIQATKLPNFKDTHCTIGFDFSLPECIEAAQAVGGVLRKDKFIVGDWANTPNACFIEARDNAIHYSHNQYGKNNGFFHSVCKPAEFEVTLVAAEKGAKCASGHDFSEQECIVAAKSVGGLLRGNAYLVGDYSNAPAGCFIETRDKAIHYNRNLDGVTAGQHQPVCRTEADEAALLPARKGTKCAPYHDFSKEDCIAAAKSVGGVLRDGKFLTGSWPYAPHQCFIEKRDGAIHFGETIGTVNNGNYQPVCIYA